MRMILSYLDVNKEISSSLAAKLLEVEMKTASRLLLKAEKLDILKSVGKQRIKYISKNKMPGGKFFPPAVVQRAFAQSNPEKVLRFLIAKQIDFYIFCGIIFCRWRWSL